MSFLCFSNNELLAPFFFKKKNCMITSMELSMYPTIPGLACPSFYLFIFWMRKKGEEIPYLGVTVIASLLVEEPMPGVVTIEGTQPFVVLIIIGLTIFLGCDIFFFKIFWKHSSLIKNIIPQRQAPIKIHCGLLNLHDLLQCILFANPSFKGCCLHIQWKFTINLSNRSSRRWWVTNA